MRIAAAFTLALAVASCSPAPEAEAPPPVPTSHADEAGSMETATETNTAAGDEAAARGSSSEWTDEQLAALEPAAGGEPEIAPGAGTPAADMPMAVPMAPSASYEFPPPPPPPPPAPTAAPATMPPAAAGETMEAMPPAAANGHSRTTASIRNNQRGAKVLSYFQRARTQIDTRRAFGFVLMPRVAITDEEKRTQKDFCQIILASMDFMTPGAVASAPREVMATYWPVVASRASFEIADAFAHRNCDELIAWYDHNLARSLAAKAGVAELTGPLLITWPSTGVDGQEARDPLIVDFSKANHARAKKALQYWFRQLRARPDLWTNRIREGTIRAELADAVNDTAGVVVAVLSGKWDSVNIVMGMN